MRARHPGLLALALALSLSACDSASVVDHAATTSPILPEQRTASLDIPEEAIPYVTAPKTLVRALDDRVLTKARSRAAAATPDQIKALVLARQAAEEVIALNGEVAPGVLDDMVRMADAALEPFFNRKDAAYLSAVIRRLDELGMSAKEFPALVKSLELEGALSKTGPCDQACVVEYTNNIAMIEFAYLGGLAACTFSGPISPFCFGAATAVKTASIISSTVAYTTCVDLCREES
jgi:hypothetical protein